MMVAVGSCPLDPVGNAAHGLPEELAAAPRADADAGISDVPSWLEPTTLVGIEASAAIPELLDRGEGIARPRPDVEVRIQVRIGRRCGEEIDPGILGVLIHTKTGRSPHGKV